MALGILYVFCNYNHVLQLQSIKGRKIGDSMSNMIYVTRSSNLATHCLYIGVNVPQKAPIPLPYTKTQVHYPHSLVWHAGPTHHPARPTDVILYLRKLPSPCHTQKLEDIIHTARSDMLALPPTLPTHCCDSVPQGAPVPLPYTETPGHYPHSPVITCWLYPPPCRLTDVMILYLRKLPSPCHTQKLQDIIHTARVWHAGPTPHPADPLMWYCTSGSSRPPAIHRNSRTLSTQPESDMLALSPTLPTHWCDTVPQEAPVPLPYTETPGHYPHSPVITCWPYPAPWRPSDVILYLRKLPSPCHTQKLQDIIHTARSDMLALSPTLPTHWCDTLPQEAPVLLPYTETQGHYPHSPSLTCRPPQRGTVAWVSLHTHWSAWLPPWLPWGWCYLVMCWFHHCGPGTWKYSLDCMNLVLFYLRNNFLNQKTR